MQQDFHLSVKNAQPVPNKPQHWSLANGEEYSIVCKNNCFGRCDVELSVDGINVGRWRIEPGSSICIERPAGVAKKFTLVEEGSALAASSGLVPHSDNGLISATFYPEHPPVAKSFCGLIAQGVQAEGGGSYRNAGTTLGANSNQKFSSTSALVDIDRSKITTLHLRLIARKDDAPISLRQYPEAVLRTQAVPQRWSE